ncbi:hypothetical protein EVAR_5993_1 [Eumeta japonica]|uniref:Uncharacterized protein n=1 Tax=Eumeta variegata TaxID=151549 RepID=A0A4C1TCI4_EUMVA|nr:hypothetical protein EVAR_5993_1 [Eumeta japonica]
MNLFYVRAGRAAGIGCIGCVQLLSLFYSDASADGVEKRGMRHKPNAWADRASLSLVPRSRSHVRQKRNATMSHAFSCVQPAFIDL